MSSAPTCPRAAPATSGATKKKRRAARRKRVKREKNSARWKAVAFQRALSYNDTVPGCGHWRYKMQISSRFTVAVHVLICIEMFKSQRKVTSDFLAASVNANPVVIRKLLLQLKAAGIVRVARGTGGADTARDPEEITLRDVYRAVECVEGGELFHFHENPSRLCPVGRNIHAVLDERLEQIQKAMEREMESISLQDVLADAQKLAAQQPSENS